MRGTVLNATGWLWGHSQGRLCFSVGCGFSFQAETTISSRGLWLAARHCPPLGVVVASPSHCSQCVTLSRLLPEWFLARCSATCEGRPQGQSSAGDDAAQSDLGRALSMVT